MQPAADVMAEALGEVAIHAPVVPVIANVRAGPLSSPDEIRQCLVEQVTGTVRWRECTEAMIAGGVTDFYELGAGKVLSGLARRIERSARATPVGTPDDVRTIAEQLSA